MSIFSVESDLRVLWVMLSLTSKFYIACLVTASAYSMVSYIRTLSRLHDQQRRGSLVESGAEISRLSGVCWSIENVRQLHLLLLLLFGMSLANEVLATLRAIRYASMSLSAANIEVFEPCAALALLVFGVLSFFQVFQWIVAARLRRALAP